MASISAIFESDTDDSELFCILFVHLEVDIQTDVCINSSTAKYHQGISSGKLSWI